MIILCQILIYFFIFALGASVFSFLNVIVYRVPKKESFVKGFSYCPACGHRLGVLDLCPIFSYMFLGGKCRYCKDRIPARDTFVEVFGGLVAMLCWYLYQEPVRALMIFIFFSILTVVTLMDWDTMEIENGCSIALLGLGVAAIFLLPDISVIARVIGVFAVSVPMLVITMIIPGAFGGGDIKLMAAAGLFLGWKLTLVSTMIGLIVGAVYAIYLLKIRKMSGKAHFPFGPFLCIGMGISILWGDAIITWYLSSMIG